MASDRQTLELEVKFALGNRTDVDANLTQWVKRAYQHITQAVEVPEALVTSTLATVVSQRIYALPADFFSIYNVVNLTRAKPIMHISFVDYDKLNIVETGPVDRYALLGVTSDTRDISVHPTPDGIETIQIRYRKLFADLSLGSTVHELPDVWDQPIVQLATAYGFESTNDIDRATFYHRQVGTFVVEQQRRHAYDLFDRNEAMAVVGGEIR